MLAASLCERLHPISPGVSVIQEGQEIPLCRFRNSSIVTPSLSPLTSYGSAVRVTGCGLDAALGASALGGAVLEHPNIVANASAATAACLKNLIQCGIRL